MSTVGADRICVALDLEDAERNIALVERLAGRAVWFKVGLRQFYSEGAHDVLAAVRYAGARLFLDLKLHDIPKTVGDAAAALGSIGPELLTVHASGGPEMVRAAVDALGADTGVLAVTVLTSLDGADLSALWGVEPDSVPAVVERLAASAVGAGAAGVVCSASEAAWLRSSLGERPLLVTPGIRTAGDGAGDQKRVVTPGRAVGEGASLLVVGRPIHGAADPSAAFDGIASEVVVGGASA